MNVVVIRSPAQGGCHSHRQRKEARAEEVETMDRMNSVLFLGGTRICRWLRGWGTAAYRLRSRCWTWYGNSRSGSGPRRAGAPISVYIYVTNSAPYAPEYRGI